MSIRRVKRPDRYTVVSNRVFDSNLSFRAVGLLAYLLSKPDNWEVSVAQLVKVSATTARPDGRDSVYSILGELIAAGYVTRHQARKGGKLSGYDYDVFDEPQEPAPCTDLPETEPPCTDLPDTAPPYTAPPYTAEPTLINTENQLVPKVQNTVIAASCDAAALEGQLVDASPKDIQALCRETWTRYAAAYHQRHGVMPPRNQKVNSLVKNLVKRLGAEAAPVAEYFVGINDRYLIRNYHDLGSLLAKCEGYHTQWATNSQMNATTAQQLERTQANMNAGLEAARQIRERNGERLNEFF
ncbi:hypothetical protein [Pseudomonas urethralis]|uniref:hypothetical protein n=1 Tax=Pseudomonas urethralis TaxID=2740517 RepID=UPI0015965722|nr:hypothetical protein [Pseudomonas urethralis]